MLCASTGTQGSLAGNGASQPTETPKAPEIDCSLVPRCCPLRATRARALVRSAKWTLPIRMVGLLFRGWPRLTPVPPLAVLVHCLSAFRRAFRTVYHLPCVSSSGRELSGTPLNTYTKRKYPALWPTGRRLQVCCNDGEPRLSRRIWRVHPAGARQSSSLYRPAVRTLRHLDGASVVAPAVERTPAAVEDAYLQGVGARSKA
jgi:hypothetical protein